MQTHIHYHPSLPLPQRSHGSPTAALGLPGVKGCKAEEKDILRLCELKTKDGDEPV